MFNLQLDWDRPVKISSQLSEHILRVRIVPKSDRTQTLPLQLAVALDTSASMQGEKWEKAKAACLSLVAQLRPCDRLSLAGYADWVTPLAQNIQNNQLGNLQSVLDTLVAEGVTRTDLALNWIRSALLSESGKARVGILITDGHPTTDRGQILEDVTTLIDRAEIMAVEGMTLCTVGLGDAADFNSALLVNLSDRGRGTFMYADNPTLLTTQLQERLQAVQTIAVADVILKLNFADGIKLNNCCQFRPDYLPLVETTPGEIHLRNLRSDTSTDVLLSLEVSALNPSQPPGNTVRLTSPPTPLLQGEGSNFPPCPGREGGLGGLGLSYPNSIKPPGTYAIAQIQLQTLEFPPFIAQAALQFTPSYREAQQINLEVDCDRLSWDINRYSTELTYADNPLQTGELLSQIQAAALKSGQIGIANQVTQQLDDLYKTGILNAHQTTSLLRTTRQLGDL